MPFLKHKVNALGLARSLELGAGKSDLLKMYGKRSGYGYVQSILWPLKGINPASYLLPVSHRANLSIPP